MNVKRGKSEKAEKISIFFLKIYIDFLKRTHLYVIIIMDNSVIYTFLGNRKTEDSRTDTHLGYTKTGRKMKIILASASPRRKEILEGLCVDFRVIVADADESCSLTDPAEYAKEIAKRKGQAVWSKLSAADRDAVIISADTVVVAAGEILGKPRDRDDAVRMIKLLSGGVHTVITGIGVTVGGVTYTSHSTTYVRVSALPESAIDEYVDSKDPFDKAGAYGIQGQFSKWIEGIDGCYFNVVGLPVNELNKLMFSVLGEYL